VNGIHARVTIRARIAAAAVHVNRARTRAKISPCVSRVTVCEKSDAGMMQKVRASFHTARDAASSHAAQLICIRAPSQRAA
jgi:hypothetical protein